MPVIFDKKKGLYVVRVFQFDRYKKIGEYETFDEAKAAEADPPLTAFVAKSRRAKVKIPGIIANDPSPYQGWTPAMFASESKKQIARLSKLYSPNRKRRDDERTS